MSRLVKLYETLALLVEEKNYEMLSAISFNHPKSAKSASRISLVTKYVLDNFEHPITFTEISEYAHMSETAFCRWFKQSVGSSFITYLNKIRIEKACQYLIYSNLNVTQIAYQTGFETLSHFNRTFQKLKNQSPSQYRQNNI